MQSPTDTWLRAMALDGVDKTYIVELKFGHDSFKFVKAARPLFGYPANVMAVTPLNPQIDPITLEETIQAITVDFVDDGLVRWLLKTYRAVGKQVNVWVAADVGVIASGGGVDVTEADYLEFATGQIDDYKVKAGIVHIITKDARGSTIDRGDGPKLQLPKVGATIGQSQASGNNGAYEMRGPACLAKYNILTDAGVDASMLDAASFQPASSPLSGHLVVDRRALPEAGIPINTNQAPGAYTIDRRLKEPTAVKDILAAIDKIARTVTLVRENGKIAHKEWDPAEASVYTFTDDDILLGTAEVGTPHRQICTSVEVKTLYDGISGQAKHNLVWRDQDGDAIVDWNYASGADRPSDVQVEDDWFTTEILRDPYAANIGAADLSIDGIDKGNTNFTGIQNVTGSWGTPLTVSAARPMYLYVWGPDPSKSAYESQPGEIVRVEGVTQNPDDSFTFTIPAGGRGQCGTTARQHGNQGGAPAGGSTAQTGSHVLLVDITAIVRYGDQLIRQTRLGPPTFKFQTMFNDLFRLQAGDVVGLETQQYIAYGVDGLDPGNGRAFRILGYSVDHEQGTIEWELFEIRDDARSGISIAGNIAINSPAGQSILPSQNGGRGPHLPGDVGQIFASSEGALAGALDHSFLVGDAPAPLAPLTHDFIIPEQVFAGPFGICRMGEQKFTSTAGKDTYLDLRPLPLGLSRWELTEVAHGAAAPAVPSNCFEGFTVEDDGTGVIAISSRRKTTPVDGAKHIVDGSVGSAVIAAGSILDSHVNAAAAIAGSKLNAGSGALANLDNAGALDFSAAHTNKHLASIPDDPGGTWRRVAGVDASNLATRSSVKAAAIGPGQIDFSTEQSLALNANADFVVQSTAGAISDGWEIVQGTMGSTIDVVAVSATGDKSLKFFNASAPFTGDYGARSAIVFPVQAGEDYLIDGTIQQASGAVGFPIDFVVEWYQSDGVTASAVTAETTYTPKAGTAGTWKRVFKTVTAPSDARFARLRVQQNLYSTSVIYVDRAAIRNPVALGSFTAFYAYNNSAQNILAGNVTKVVFDAESYDYGEVFDSATNYYFTAPASGLYLLTATVALGAFATGKRMFVELFKNGATALAVGEQKSSGVAGTHAATVTCIVVLGAGETVEARIFNGDAATRTVVASYYQSYFMGIRLT